MFVCTVYNCMYVYTRIQCDYNGQPSAKIHTKIEVADQEMFSHLTDLRASFRGRGCSPPLTNSHPHKF